MASSSVGVYLPVDTGPSGHGQVSRGHVEALLEHHPEVRMTVRTHKWGWNREGIALPPNREFTDSRFEQRVMGSERFNDEYLISDLDELQDDNGSLMQNAGTPDTVSGGRCPIMELTSDEEMDVWHTVGSMDFADTAPLDDDDTAVVVETDWNLDIVPRSWPSYARDVAEVWVPNEWNRKQWEARGFTDNVHVVPYGIDFKYEPTQYDCSCCPNEGHMKPPGSGQCLDDDTFTFGAVARWYHIKGVDLLLEAYLREFSGDEDVRLFLKTTMNQHREFDSSEPAQFVGRMAQDLDIDDPPEVGIRTESLNDQRFMDLLGTFDGFVMPSRAECVGIAWAQAMHARTPVVTTNWSAMAEYLNDDVAILVDEYDVVQPQPRVDGLTFAGGAEYPYDSHWADVDIGALQSALREMYEMSDTRREQMAQRGREHVHEVFDWETAIKARVERYNEVAAQQ